ncbi:MAG: SPOR domain-containing protein [Litorimonas sp.]
MSADGPEFNPVMQPDEPLTPFDVTRTSERAGLLKLIIGFGFLLVLAFIVLKLYQPGVRDRGDPPLITAENTPFKIVPEEAGGMQTPDQDKEVFDVMSGNDPSTDVITLPPPEQPVEMPQSSQDQPAQSNPAPVRATPDPVVQQPVTRPQVTPEPAQPTLAPPAAGNSEWIVQVASLRSQAEAETTYAAIRAKNSAILSSYRSDIVRVDLAEKGIYYRARVAGFRSRADASATCDRLKAAGQSCFVARR